MKRAYIYIDGFNLYYGSLKGTPFKWLNIEEMCSKLFPKLAVVKIKYFTATVQPRDDDLDFHVRQQIYIRAIKTLPKVEIYYGHYLTSVKTLRLAKPIGKNKFAQVIKAEEKGSDVNLACHLLLDAFKDNSDVGIVISNDSDLTTPVRMAREEFQKQIGYCNPHYKNAPSAALKKAATFQKQIREGLISASQFPAILSDSKGQFHKPTKW